MKALVTGGAGFIGSHLADALLAAGHEVRILDDLSSGSLDVVAPDVEYVHGSVTDEQVVRWAVRDVEVVFHQAAHRAVQRSVDHPLATDQANTHGTVTLLTAAVDAGVRRLVYASSSSVYGGAETMPTPETVPLHPRSPYAVSKLAGEHYCRVFAHLHTLETVALRYFNVYGPRQRPDSAYAAVVPLFMQALSQGDAPLVHGDGLQSRDFTYVDDVVRANLAAAQAPGTACSGKAYNVAGGASYSLLELLDILGNLLGTAPRPVFTEPRAGDVRHTGADISAACRDLGHVPAVGFAAGLRRTVESFAIDQGRCAAHAGGQSVLVGGGCECTG
jgi:UDP-glucose 4-epimerase